MIGCRVARAATHPHNCDRSPADRGFDGRYGLDGCEGPEGGGNHPSPSDLSQIGAVILTTADLLTQMLSAVMGKTTVNPSDFFGPGCTDPEIPSRCFLSDRLRRHTGAVDEHNDLCRK